MSINKKIEWILRIGVAGEFLGHGILAIQGKPQWIQWVQELAGFSADNAATIIMIIGLMDVALAVLVLIKPIRIALLWMAFWGF